MIYLDNAATTIFKPDIVINAVTETLRHFAGNPGRSGHKAAIEASMIVHGARVIAAEFFGAEPDRVIFCSGCTDALNLALLGSIRHGNVVTSVLEHNSILRPLFELERLGRITLTVVEPDGDGRVSPQTIANAMRDDTYLVALTHVSNVTGIENPIREIGRFLQKKDVLFVVDAAQSAGHIPVNIKNDYIDMLAVPGHKGLHAPQGIGVLVLNKRVRLNPIRFGGTGTGSESVYQPISYPEGFESGTPATALIAGLKAAFEWSGANMRNFSKVRALTAQTIAALSRNRRVRLLTRDDSENGVISFNIDGFDSPEVCNILDEDFDIAARGGLHCAPLTHKFYGTLKTGAVRASFGTETSPSDIDALLSAITAITG